MSFGKLTNALPFPQGLKASLVGVGSETGVVRRFPCPFIHVFGTQTLHTEMRSSEFFGSFKASRNRLLCRIVITAYKVRMDVALCDKGALTEGSNATLLADFVIPIE